MNGKISRTRASTAAIAAALLLAMPILLLIAPVHATSITSITPTSGPEGTLVTLTGTIDTFNGPFKVFFDANGDGTFDPGEVVATGTAVGTSVSVSFNVPPAVKGLRAIRLTDEIANTHGFGAFTVERVVSITFTPSTGRIQEGDTIDITVSISGGLDSTAYNIDIKVTDPTGTTFTTSASIATNTVGSGSTSKTYPTQFTGATTNFVGTYNVVVDITAPAGEAGTGVATGSFVVGLTDKDSYGRQAVVNIKGAGYDDDETVTVNVEDPSGASVSGYPKTVTADSDGEVTDSFTIPKNAPTGTYTVTLTGASTTKTPPDTQTFAVTAAALSVTITDQPASSYQRTQTATMKFRVQYPDDSFFTPSDLGSLTVKVFRGATLVDTLTLTASNFEIGTNKWVASWTIPKDATTASNYKFQIDANAITDTFGNTGPGSAVSSNNFAVTAAALSVTITDQPASSYQRTQTATMKFRVQYPDDSFFTPSDLGSLTVKVFRGATLVDTLTLTASNFEIGTNKWVASWTIPKDATTASNYKFQIDANAITDTFGNTGPGSAVSSNNFAVSPTTLTVPAISTDNPTYVGGSWMIIFFTASYPDGSPVTTGTATITIKRPDGSTAGTPPASFSAAHARFEASFFLPADAPLGTWTAQLAVNGLNDGFGNTGPAALITTTFQVVAPTITLETIYNVLTTQVVGKLGTFSGSDTVASLLYDIKTAVTSLDLTPVISAINSVSAKLGTFSGSDTVASLLYDIKTAVTSLDLTPVISAINSVSAKLGTFSGSDTVASLLYDIKTAVTSLDLTPVRAGDVVASKAETDRTATSATPYVIGGFTANKAFRGTLTVQIDTALGSGVFLAVQVWDGDSWATVWRSATGAPAGTAVSIDIAGLTDGSGNAVRIVTNAATARQFDYVFVYHIDLG
jgi:hypothetical protein